MWQFDVWHTDTRKCVTDWHLTYWHLRMCDSLTFDILTLENVWHIDIWHTDTWECVTECVFDIIKATILHCWNLTTCMLPLVVTCQLLTYSMHCQVVLTFEKVQHINRLRTCWHSQENVPKHVPDWQLLTYSIPIVADKAPSYHYSTFDRSIPAKVLFIYSNTELYLWHTLTYIFQITPVVIM